MINMELARKLLRSNEEIELIKRYQAMCDSISNAMKDENDPEILKQLSNSWNKYQYKLQEQWGFDKNPTYHRSWELPKCTCPKIDNEEAYPYRRYVNTNCILHGNKTNKKQTDK